MTEKVAILGSTGSVGVTTLDVIRRHPERFDVSALAANKNSALMLEQCLEFLPQHVVMVDNAAAETLRTELKQRNLSISVSAGARSLDALVELQFDCVVCAIVGAAGLPSTLAAVRKGSKVLIANKEPLVMLGPAIMKLAQQHQATILPLDSEHNAIFQCLPDAWKNRLGDLHSHQEFGVRKVLLTGSGGPFRQVDLDTFAKITPEQACAHPNWNMGKKISVDSATMMNKGLELIEACVLFGIDESMVEIVIHPQSAVHSMVEFVDGSVIAQMANPDMGVPIANALGWPSRIESGVSSLDLFSMNRFDFEPPDTRKFPALGLARKAAQAGGNAPAVLNAANEIAVAAFLANRIRFDQITTVVSDTIDVSEFEPDVTLASAIASDEQARTVATKLVASCQV